MAISGDDLMNDEAVFENVRRYRAIASLCRQTATFRPLQKFSLLQQAEDWERLAMRQLGAHVDSNYVDSEEEAEEDLEPQAEPQVDTRWWLPRREGLFARLEG